MRPSRYLRLLALLLCLSLTTACGIRFSDEFEGTETFDALSLEGERVPNSELTLTVTFKQTYPVPLQVACYYEDSGRLTEDEENIVFQERATRIGETVLPPSREHRPGDEDAEEQTLSFRFSIARPGEYFVACLTPAAAENGIGIAFKIRDTSETGASR